MRHFGLDLAELSLRQMYSNWTKIFPQFWPLLCTRSSDMMVS